MTTHTPKLQKRAQDTARPSATTQTRAETPENGSPLLRLGSELLLPFFFYIGFILLLDPLWPLGQLGATGGDILQMVRPYGLLPVLGLLVLVVTGFISWRRLCWRVNHIQRFRSDHCPHCGGTDLRRAPRKPLERRIANMGIHVRRYICHDCRWRGPRIEGALVRD